MSQANKARTMPETIVAGIALTAVAGLPVPAHSHDYVQEYFDRSDTITTAPGDASKTNKSMHYITRWPKASQDDRWLSDGEVARRAAVRYRTNKVTPPRTLTDQKGNEVPQADDTPEPSAITKSE